MLDTVRIFYRKHYLVTALFVVLIALLVGFVLMEYVIKHDEGARSKFAIIALQSILTAIIIGLAISIVERLASVEKNRMLADEIDDRIKTTLNLKLEHGFRLIHHEIKEIEKIDAMEMGEICWVNTMFRDYDKNWTAIQAALERGVSVKLLLMHKDNPSRESRGKYTCQDIEDPKRIQNSIEKYIDDLANKQKKLIIDFENYKKDKEKGHYKGELKIRFYNDTPGLPLFILNSGAMTKAFSGFYLDSYSGDLPYIEWLPRDEGKGLVENLRNYFNKKWEFAKQWDIEKLSEQALDGPAAETDEPTS